MNLACVRLESHGGDGVRVQRHGVRPRGVRSAAKVRVNTPLGKVAMHGCESGVNLRQVSGYCRSSAPEVSLETGGYR